MRKARGAVSAGKVRAGLGSFNTMIAPDAGRQPLHPRSAEEAWSPSRFAADSCPVGHKSEVQQEATRRSRSGQRDVLVLATSGRVHHEDENKREEEEEEEEDETVQGQGHHVFQEDGRRGDDATAKRCA